MAWVRKAFVAKVHPKQKDYGGAVAFHCGFGIATEVTQGTRRYMLQKPPKNTKCLRPPSLQVSLLHRRIPR